MTNVDVATYNNEFICVFQPDSGQNSEPIKKKINISTMSSRTNQEPKALGKLENVRDFIVCVPVVLHGIMKCLLIDYYAVLLHINIYNITLINKVVYIQTNCLNWREAYDGFICKGLEEYQFHFLPPRNPRVSETIHTRSRGRVLVAQGGL